MSMAFSEDAVLQSQPLLACPLPTATRRSGPRTALRRSGGRESHCLFGTELASMGHLLSPKGNIPEFPCFSMVLPDIYSSLNSVSFCLFVRSEKWYHVVCNFCDLLCCCCCFKVFLFIFFFSFEVGSTLGRNLLKRQGSYPRPLDQDLSLDQDLDA